MNRLVQANIIGRGDDEIDRLRKGIQAYLEGNYGPKIGKIDKCPHGRFGYEACEACIDAHFTALLSSG